MGFRKDFVWGVAASAFQTEGEANKDGKGDSIWDVFMHEKNGKIYENMNADMATDFYNRYKEDDYIDFYRNLEGVSKCELVGTDVVFARPVEIYRLN